MRVGIDLGGTKIEVVALDDGGVELLRRRVPTPADYDDALRQIVALVQGVEQEVGRSGSVGVGMPGIPSPVTGLVKNANSTWLNGRAFERDLAAGLGRQVRVANDANCLALSEARDGAAAGAQVVFAVILGTGVGGGLVVNGQLVVGAAGVTGEWGHTPLPWPSPEELPGPTCWCGRSGCIETWLSGPGLEADHHRGAGVARTGAEIAAAAQRGDADAQASLARHADRLARGLGVVVTIVDPDVVVLGGGVSNIAALPAAVMDRLHRHVFGGEVRTQVRTAVHGDSSGVRGAAWLWD